MKIFNGKKKKENERKENRHESLNYLKIDLNNEMTDTFYDINSGMDNIKATQQEAFAILADLQRQLAGIYHVDDEL